MDPEFQPPASPGLPLFPLSSERANARKRQALDPDQQPEAMAHQLSPSPSLSALPHLLQGRGNHFRGSSDVQGKVAQFNGLAKEAAQRRKDSEAALKRAIMGREEAESESRRLRDTNEILRKENEEGRGRERRALEKAQALQHEMEKLKDKHAREHAIFEKEVKRSRKEAFSSSSKLVACQEELRSARNRFTLMREEMESQKRLKEQRELDLAQAKASFNGVEEQMEGLRRRLELVEEEKKALKLALNTEEVARVASQGSIPLPVLPENDEFASPRKRRRGERESLKENVDPQNPISEEDEEELMALKEDLRMEKRLRKKAEEEAHFLKMECQFGVCSCRIAEQSGEPFVHDNSFSAAKSSKPEVRSPTLQPSLQEQPAPHATHETEAKPEPPIDHAISIYYTEVERPVVERTDSNNTAVRFSPNSGTFSKNPSPTHATSTLHVRGGGGSPDPSPHPSTPERQLASSPPPVPATTHAHPLNRPPIKTPRPLPNLPAMPKTVSHITTTVPLRADDPVFSPAPNTPGGISREEALERIRARRGRARSFAVGIGGTPGRGSVREGSKDERAEGRVISAPVGTGGAR